MINSLPQAIVFDWDNTLVDSWEAIAEALNFTRGQFNLEPWTLEQVELRCTRAARDSFPDWFGIEKWQNAYDVYYKSFDEVRQRVGIRKKPGTDDLLGFLKSQDIPLFVVSNKRGDYLRQEVLTLGWNHYFVSVIGATDAPKDKPARDPVDMALAQAQLKANKNIWFVGDSDTDVLCAHNSGCLPVFVGSPEKAEMLAVDSIFSDCQQLQTLLNKYKRKMTNRGS